MTISSDCLALFTRINVDEKWIFHNTPEDQATCGKEGDSLGQSGVSTKKAMAMFFWDAYFELFPKRRTTFDEYYANFFTHVKMIWGKTSAIGQK